MQTLTSIIAATLWLLLIAFVTIHHAKAAEHKSITIPLKGVEAFNEQRQIACIAEAVFHEAKGEPLKGMEAVAHVVANRANSGRFSASPCDVIKEPNQFEFVNHNHQIDNEKIYIAALFLAEKVWLGKLQDFTGGALWYFSPSLQKKRGKKVPNWITKKQLALEIGNHLFYRDR